MMSTDRQMVSYSNVVALRKTNGYISLDFTVIVLQKETYQLYNPC